MRTIVSLTAICAALGFLTTLLPDSVGQYVVGNEQQAMEDAFQQQLDDAIERGDIVKQIQPDGRVMYINAALVNQSEQASQADKSTAIAAFAQ